MKEIASILAAILPPPDWISFLFGYLAGIGSMMAWHIWATTNPQESKC